MGWVTIGILIASYLYTRYMQSKMKAPDALAPADTPTATEGTAIPVVFGCRTVPNPNIVWCGDKSIRQDGVTQQGAEMYYHASMHLAICHGKLDALLDVFYSDKSCWAYTIALGDPVVGKLNSFHNDYSLESYQEGITGDISVSMGGANLSTTDIGVSDYLAGQLGSGLGPKYYGVAMALLRQCGFGPSPYLRPCSFAVKRIHTRNGGTAAQWYDAKSEIARGTRSRQDVWKYKVQDPGDSSDWSGTGFDDSAWSQGKGGIGNAPRNYDLSLPGTFGHIDNYTTIPFVGTQIPSDGTNVKGTWPNSYVVNGTKLWLRWDLGKIPVYPLSVNLWHDDSGSLWFNGTPLTLTPTNTALVKEHFTSTAVIPANLINPNGPNVVAYRVTQVGNNAFVYAGVQVGTDAETPAGVCDMNPAHIVHEVLTDSIWGMGYTDSDLDDTAFRDAADTLYDEGLGMSFVWSQQMTIEDFLNDVLRHISGILYVDRATGLFVLKLIRADYSVGSLTVLDESNVSKIEDAVRRQPGETVNTVTITYASTLRGDSGSVTLFDEGLLNSQGGYVTSKIDYPAITTPMNAAKVALRDLRMLSSPLLSCRVTADRHAAKLQIGDPFVLSWPDLGINSYVMRVTEIDLGNGINNAVKVTCIEDVFFFPTQAMTITSDPSSTSRPATNPLAALSNTDLYQTAQTLDTRNQGMVECLYTATGEADLFASEWTEGPTGTWTRNTAGPLSAAFFDGVDPGTFDHSGTSWLLTRRVLGVQHGVSSYDRQNTGPMIVDDVGGHWVDYGLPTQAYVSTHAQMHRDPSFSASADFKKNIIFQARNGTLYSDHYFEMTTDNVVLGTTQMDWSDLGTSVSFTGTLELIRSDQIADQILIPDSTLQESATFAGGFVDMDGFRTLVGTPGATSIPAGPWIVTPSNCTVSGGDVGAITTLGFKFLRDVGPALLFELQTPALVGGFQTLDPLTYHAPQYPILATDRIVLVPTLHTNSTTPVTISLSYNAAGAITVRIPKATTTPVVDESWYDVTLVSGCIPNFGDHRRLKVHGTGPLVGIDATGLSVGAQLTLSFADAMIITINGTPTTGAAIDNAKHANVGTHVSDILTAYLDSGTAIYWRLA